MIVSFLLSHNPNPRFSKRMNEACNLSKVNLVYWDRKESKSIPFTIDHRVNVEEISVNAPIRNNIKRILPYLKFLPKALNTLKKQNPDLIHCGKIDMLFIAVIYKKIINKKTSIIYEVGDLPRFINTKTGINKILTKAYMLVEKILCSEIKKLVLTSEHHWHSYYNKITNSSKYIIIPNIPDDRYFEYFKEKNTSDFTIGFFGALRYPHQLKMLVEATIEAGINVIIAGTGGELEFVKKLDRNFEHVEYLGPYDYSKDISNLYSKVDMVYSVYDLNRENVKTALPNKLFEAITCELPIIVAENTELGNFVKKHHIGFTTPYDDTEQLKQNLLQLNNHYLTSYKNNLKEIKKVYNYSKVKQSISELYQ